MPASTATVARGNGGRHAPRGAATRRRGGRADRDGDLMMDVATKGRGRIGKSSAPASPSLRPTNPVSKSSRGGILSSTAQRAILRQAAAGEVSTKQQRHGPPRGALVELKITGWEKSKASHDKDGGVSSLIRWLEKKASMRLGSGRRDVKIKKVRRRRTSDGHLLLQKLAASGPPSFAANFRTTTAIQ